MNAPSTTAEVLRLYEVQEELVGSLTHQAHLYFHEQAFTHLHHNKLSLICRRRPWPRFRVFWRWSGNRWPVQRTRKGWKLTPRWRFFTRHWAEEWYGLIEYLNIGPICVEVGRDPALERVIQPAYLAFSKLTEDSRERGAAYAQDVLRRANERAGRG